MDYQGFHSIQEYERECGRVGCTTTRIPFHKGDDQFFALVVSPPGHPTGTSVASWTLFTADESACVMDGIISGGTMDPAQYMRDGLDVNWLGKLAAHGYCQDAYQEPTVPVTPEYSTGEDGQLGLLF